MHIIDIQKLRGVLICPKCRRYTYDVKLSKSNQRMENHVSQCTGEFKKSVVLSKLKPYITHIMNNKILKYLLSNNFRKRMGTNEIFYNI